MAPNIKNFRCIVFVMKMKEFGHQARDFFKRTLFENFIKF